MNCKPGDLAFTCGRFSRVVERAHGRIVQLASLAPILAPDGWHWRLTETVFVRSLVADPSCGVLPGDVLAADYWPDSDLRPLRDSDGQDETLSWGKLTRPSVL